jgi:homoserine kinase
VLARAPASSANLGPGFDVLAVALRCYCEVRVEPAQSFSALSRGPGRIERALAPDHPAVRAARAALGERSFSLEVASEIPVGRGLGSSAAVTVAAAVAGGADQRRAFEIAAGIEGHPDNAAAASFGGLVAAMVDDDGRPEACRLPLDGELGFVVVVPEREVATADARRVLPSVVPLRDATFNLQRLALLVASLGDRRAFVRGAMADRLHQAARAALFPEAAGLISSLEDAGALGACWSGAGSSLLAVVERSERGALASAATALLERFGVPGQVLELDVDQAGAQVVPTPTLLVSPA